jgi:high-affinity K+ transport system ATPase subunit B
LLVVVGALILTSCGAKYHLKRAIAKDPTIVQKDTVKLDTVIVTEIKTVRDTFVVKGDTSMVFVNKGVKTQIKVVRDTFEIQTTCPPDTVRIEKEILVPKVVYQEKTPNFDIVKLILVLLIIISLIAFLRKLINYTKWE